MTRVIINQVAGSRSVLNKLTKSGVQVRGFAAASEEALRKTQLYDFHVQHGGTMVGFAGWSLPVKYDDLSVIQSHIHTRENASIFDVSHMLQSKLTGADRVKFIERLVVGDIEGLKSGEATLSLFTNENGGIIDDTIVTKHDNHVYIVSNAGCADKDLAHIRAQLAKFQNEGGDVDFQVVEDHSLLALQGPKAAKALQELTNTDLSQMNFMTAKATGINGVDCHLARSGYTGEDGFEISVPHSEAVALAEKLLKNGDVKLAGLGARDSLRLEAGLCLYGNDLDETISPLEGTLLWTIGKRRRAEGGFLGAEKIIPQIKGGVSKKRVGLLVQGAPARENAIIYDLEDKEIGRVTSGCPSPILKKNIAIGYVNTPFAKSGTQLKVKVRSKVSPAVVTKMPFVPSNYFKV
ncbi:hypothetical protein CONCODRAFT_9956 [Conidiobolus coronatus NRRL 28638]|uniref:Aminomethyltransferase n=1 Tax=Conidiobolus coronatus (strain ATCC 28846 / CBS 209.66 / NRRL 28638) TaxID=796925 RepID=A0A137NZ17_CONC2|nr:hypothetical protein CONCODRAFT_9956 [Conidiobolus coronatus NRRL 28638]|eukprot:KXN67891.1 hypothetical protein CONCODRAFT_9956 [Conidiobolus coronatus NRRL 28638]